VGENHNVTTFIMSGTHSAPFTLGPITFKEPGTYSYRCTNHSQTIEYLGLVGMRGYIVVR
jgi:plastocyanin